MATLKNSPEKGPSLSERQQQILGLLAEGKSNKEIAADLEIEQGTVKQHLFVLFRKLGVVSRAKAAVVAEQLLKTSNGRRSEVASSKVPAYKKGHAVKKAERYQWRLISAVSLALPDFVAAATSFEAISLRNHFLADFQARAAALLESLDGQFSITPDGGLVAWFGHPKTHLDDTDRTTYFAQCMYEWMQAYVQINQPAFDGVGKVDLGVGVASHPELVEEGVESLYSADAFRKATLLAQHSKIVHRPLSDLLTKKLSANSLSWMDIRTREGGKAIQVRNVGEICAIGSATGALVDSSAQWGGLPFMNSICESVKESVAQWLSVESWPPLAASSLMDAMGNFAYAKGIRLLRLRAPSNQRRDRLLASYIKQIEVLFETLGLEEKKIYSTGGERIAGLLGVIAQSGPLMVELYGLKTLDSFKALLGEASLDLLAARPIIFVTANLPQTGNKQTCVRLLGSRPHEQPFTRTFTMTQPEITTFPEGIQVDFQAMLDSLSEASRAILIKAAEDTSQSLASCITQECDSHHKAQACIHELTSLGLIVPGIGGGFEFRDSSTIEAIHRLGASPLEMHKE